MISSVSALSRAGVLADRAQQRHRLQHQLRRLQDDLAHLLHLRLEAAHFEQRDGLGGLVHLVDGIVQRADQVLDVGAVERRDEGAPHRGQHLPRNLVGLVLATENLLAMQCSTVIAALQQAAQRLGPATTRSACCSKRSKKRSSLGMIAWNQPSIDVSLRESSAPAKISTATARWAATSGSGPRLERRLHVRRQRAHVRRHLGARLEVGLGVRDQRGIAQRLDREARHHLGGIDHALLGADPTCPAR